jgi:aryl sulfotransferase
MSLWVDLAFVPLPVMLEGLEAQTHRRFLKSHLPLDGLPYQSKVKYLVVCRDGRDIGMSMWNHYSNYNELFFNRAEARGKELGMEFPAPQEDINTFWRDWCTKEVLDSQSDGWPHWSDLHVMQSWWEHRHLPNIKLVHYANMLADTPGAIREVAAFLGIDVSDARVNEIAGMVSFDNMKANGDKYAPGGGRIWEGGTDTFFNKGTNERWREEITPENLALYDQAADRALSPDCRRWTEAAGPLP